MLEIGWNVAAFFGETVICRFIFKEDLRMDVGHLQRRFLEYTASLFNEGFLDGQFTQLQQLQDESNSDFVVEVVSLFFEDSEKLLSDLPRAM